MTDTSTVEPDNSDGAGSNENPGLLSVKPIENEAVENNDEISHLVQETDELVAAEPTAPAERPENIPEQFWKDGAVDSDGMAKAYSDLRAKMDSGKHKPPKDGKYDLSSFESLNEGDETMEDFLEIAKDENLSQGLVERLTSFYMEATGAVETEVKFRRDEEMSKLGRNADKVVQSMDNWLSKMNTAGVLNNVELEAVANASTNAAFISALNKIRRSYNEPDIPSVSDTSPDAVSMDDITQMITDPKYGVDMAFTRQVERKVYEMHGEKTA